MSRASLLTFVALIGFASSVLAQDDFRIAKPGGTTGTAENAPTLKFGSPSVSADSTTTAPREDYSFENRRHQKRFEEVLADLREIVPCDGEESAGNDWFVVGGAITDKRSGQSLVKFNKVQGEEALAYEVVKFLYAPRGNMSIGWRVFERAQTETTADEQLASVQEEYRQWQIKQAELERERQQRIARSQARMVSQNSRAQSFFRGSSRGRYCPGGG